MVLDLLEHALRSELLEERDVHNLDLIVPECLWKKRGHILEMKFAAIKAHTFLFPERISLMKSMEHSENGGRYLCPSLVSTL